MKFNLVTVQYDDLPDWVKELRIAGDAARAKIIDAIEATPMASPYRQQAVDRFEELMAEYEPLVKRLEDGTVRLPDQPLATSVSDGHWDTLLEVIESIRRYQGN